MDMVELSKRRYTTKAYDASKKIPQEQVQQLCDLLQNAPSSVNSQPWHFVVVGTDEGKNRIIDGIAAFNRNRVMNASHCVVFCARKVLSESFLEHLLEQEDADGRFPSPKNKEEQRGGRRHFVNLNSVTEQAQMMWKGKQVYTAMGWLLLGAASLGIDATPIEGFDAVKMDELLGLEEKGLTSVVVVSLGYRSKEDFNATLPKSRLPQEEIFTFL